MSDNPQSDGPGLTLLGKLISILLIGGLFFGAYVLLSKGSPQTSGDENPPAPPKPATPEDPQPRQDLPPGQTVTVGIAYGTEKKLWMQWALEEFGKTDAGRRVRIELIPMGSLEAAHAVLAGDKRIQVWSPASSAYKDVFVQEWKGKYGEEPIVREENLALSPMVFAMWKERGDAFVARYKEASFQTLGDALAEKGGWNAIAQKPEWGLFKLGHTHPNESNSGLITLVMMSYSYHKKSKGLEMKDILDTGFQTWMQEFERGVSGLSNSTGNMMKEMVLKGPSSYDALVVYENVVIDYLKSAQGRWGDLHVYYPKLNMWNENPYYVLGASWSSKEQRAAAGTFLDFLMSEPIQRKALDHGFRPGNPSIAINQADSPFVLYKKNGLQIDIDTVCEPPRSEVVNNLLAAWQRSQGRR